jgi:hypothetical protein
VHMPIIPYRGVGYWDMGNGEIGGTAVCQWSVVLGRWSVVVPYR